MEAGGKQPDWLKTKIARTFPGGKICCLETSWIIVYNNENHISFHPLPTSGNVQNGYALGYQTLHGPLCRIIRPPQGSGNNPPDLYRGSVWYENISPDYHSDKTDYPKGPTAEPDKKSYGIKKTLREYCRKKMQISFWLPQNQ